MGDSLNFNCNWRQGFVPNPQCKDRVGYLVAFEGCGLEEGQYLAQDLEVIHPFNNSEAKYDGLDDFETPCAEAESVKVVGVLEQFFWGGAAGDPFHVTAYISTENQTQIAAKFKTTMETTAVSKLAWWICNYDIVDKVWYEECYIIDPAGYTTGMLNAHDNEPVLSIASEGTRIAPNLDMQVWKMSMEVIPAANQFTCVHYASSAKTKAVKNWGVVIGENPGAALEAARRTSSVRSIM